MRQRKMLSFKCDFCAEKATNWFEGPEVYPHPWKCIWKFSSYCSRHLKKFDWVKLVCHEVPEKTAKKLLQCN